MKYSYRKNLTRGLFYSNKSISVLVSVKFRLKGLFGQSL